MFYEEFEDADNPDQPARAVLQSRVLVIDSATLPPGARLAVASSERPGAAFAVIEDPENEAGGSDALRGVRYPAKRQSI